MGVGNDKSDPNGAMTRAMFVTVLWRLAGKPSREDPFPSRTPFQTHTTAKPWYGLRKTVLFKDTETGSSASTTRLHKRADVRHVCKVLEYMGYDVPENRMHNLLPISNLISSWAKDAVEAAAARNRQRQARQPVRSGRHTPRERNAARCL